MGKIDIILDMLSLSIILFIIICSSRYIIKEGYGNRQYLKNQVKLYNDKLNNPEDIKIGNMGNEIEKCNIIDNTKDCNMLANSKCGYCYEGNKYIYGNTYKPLGINNEPIADVCPKDKWVSPGKNAVYECKRMQGQGICDKVKDCGSTIGNASICGWCPIENKAMVKDNKGEPLYKNDKTRPDKCKWSDPKKTTTLISGINQCKQMGNDFPCLNPNPKTGPHSTLCYQDLWDKVGCKTNMVDSITNQLKYKLWDKSSYINVFNNLKYYFNKTNDNNYNIAKQYNTLCLNNKIDPCDIKYKDNNKQGRPIECLKKLYKQTGCSDKGLLNPIYEDKWGKYTGMPYIRELLFHGNNKEQVKRAKEAIRYHRKIISNDTYVNSIKEIKRMADKYNSTLNKTNMNKAILYNKACYGKYPTIPTSFNKPCWADFILRMNTIDGIVVKPNRLLINNVQFRLANRVYINKSDYDTKYFPYWDYELKLKQYWDNNWQLFKAIVLKLPYTMDMGNDIKFLPKCILNNITNLRLNGHYTAYIFSNGNGYRTIPFNYYKHPNYPYWAIINMAKSYY